MCLFPKNTHVCPEMWTLISAETTCEDDVFGVGKEEDIVTVACDEGKVGQQQYKCTNSKWVILQDNCVLEDFKDLEDQSEVMRCWTLEDFLDPCVILRPAPPGSCEGLLWLLWPKMTEFAAVKIVQCSRNFLAYDMFLHLKTSWNLWSLVTVTSIKTYR